MVFTMWGGLGVATHVGTAMISYTVINDNQAPWTTYTDVGLIIPNSDGTSADGCSMAIMLDHWSTA